MKAGDSATTTGTAGNSFAKYYDMEVVDKVKQVMATLVGEGVDHIDAWRGHGDSPNDNLEDKLCTFLLRVCTFVWCCYGVWCGVVWCGVVWCGVSFS